MSAAALDLLARSTLLLLLVAAGARAVGTAGGSAAMRHAIWHLGFAGLAALPLLAWVLPTVSIAILPAAPAAAPVLAAQDLDPMSSAATSGGQTPGFAVVAALLYAAIGIAVLGRHLIGRVLIEQMWRGSDRAGENAGAVLDSLRTALGMRRRVALRIARQQLVPMTWGSLRPRILLPADARDWSAERMRAVLLHELGHVARLDGPARLLADAVCAAYWIHPGVWAAARHMRLAQEQACDDFVLAAERDGPAYARILLDCAGSIRPGSALAMAGRTDLERRLRAILSNVPRRRAEPTFVIAVTALTAGAASLAAAVTPVAATIAMPVMPTVETPDEPTLAAPAAPAVPEATPKAAPHNARARRQAAVAVAVIEAAPPATAALPQHRHDYQAMLERYREQTVRYRQQLAEFEVRREDYRRALVQYRVDYAEYGRRLAEHRSTPWAPEPIPPVAPVAPAEPVAPPVPPTPPDLSPHA